MRSSCVPAIVLLLLCGCAAVKEECSFSGADNRRSVELAAGRSFAVTLESNPTTGYGWQLEKLSSDSPVKAVKEEFFAPESRLCGAPGHSRFTFQAMKPGTAKLKLSYRRPWEKGIPPIQSYELQVSVR